MNIPGKEPPIPSKNTDKQMYLTLKLILMTTTVSTDEIVVINAVNTISGFLPTISDKDP